MYICMIYNSIYIYIILCMYICTDTYSYHLISSCSFLSFRCLERRPVGFPWPLAIRIVTLGAIASLCEASTANGVRVTGGGEQRPKCWCLRPKGIEKHERKPVHESICNLNSPGLLSNYSAKQLQFFSFNLYVNLSDTAQPHESAKRVKQGSFGGSNLFTMSQQTRPRYEFGGQTWSLCRAGT